MGDVINLRQARKQLARRRDHAEAAANRERFGRTKGERQKNEAERAEAERRLDNHRLERPDDDPDGPDVA